MEQSADILSYVELDAAVESLEPIPIDQVGSKAWRKQREVLEQLNMQSHLNVALQKEETVTELLISKRKLVVIVHELLVIELWKEHVFPRVKERLVDDSTTAYFIIRSEAVILNLLEIVLFYEAAVEALSEQAQEQAAIELVDYCYRKLIHLQAEKTPEAPELHYVPRSPGEMLDEQMGETAFLVAMSSLAVTRYLTQNAKALSLSTITRLMKTNDIIMALVPLILKKPWQRHNRKGEFERFIDGKWTVVDARNIQKLTQPDATAWITLCSLLLDPRFRSQYQYDESRQAEIVKLRDVLGDSTLVDQLPVLADLQRAVAEVGFMAAPHATAVQAVVIEQVPEMREAIRRDVNWSQLAEAAKGTIFAPQSEVDRLKEMKSLADLYSMDKLEPLLEPPRCAQCGGAAVQRCSKCKAEWYCGRECQVAGWKLHKNLCALMTKKDNGSSSA